jgi:hypothetical protein
VVWLASLFDDGRRGTETVALWIKPATDTMTGRRVETTA